VTIEPDAPEPIWAQLAALLRDEIASGRLPKRSRLPSINELAAQHGIATATVVKALRALRDEGLIIGVPGRGTFVA
jgi:DNA-binding GntR family transcriptional regulator